MTPRLVSTVRSLRSLRSFALALGLTAGCTPSETDVEARVPSDGQDAGEKALATNRPNIVFILADDVGYGDLKTYGHPYAQTNNLDQLARDGAKFNRFYVTGPICNPSRTGFMTSKHPMSYPKSTKTAGFQGHVTITEVLKNAGYQHIGHCGKWHIGPDESDGTYGIDEVNVIGGDQGNPKGRDRPLAKCATDFLESHKSDGPFFLQVWMHTAHFPVQPNRELLDRVNLTFNEADFDKRFGKVDTTMREKFRLASQLGVDPATGMRNYVADMLGLDENVGRILKQIDQAGLRDNTLVVFSSDHGPAPVKVDKEDKEGDAVDPSVAGNMLGWAGGLRGGKHEISEGGVTVPFIVRWPGHIAPQTVNNSVLSSLDWLPSIAAIAGARVDAQIEGEDMSDVLLGQSSRSRKNSLFWSAGDKTAVRSGKWKLLRGRKNRQEIELYNLETDPTESQNLASSFPSILQKLEAELNAWEASWGAG